MKKKETTRQESKDKTQNKWKKKEETRIDPPKTNVAFLPAFSTDVG
jgi:hypothetical protein